MDGIEIISIDELLRDVRLLELKVGNVLGGVAAEMFRNNYDKIILPREHVYSSDYNNLISKIKNGGNIEWQSDIGILRKFKSELENYRKIVSERK